MARYGVGNFSSFVSCKIPPANNPRKLKNATTHAASLVLFYKKVKQTRVVLTTNEARKITESISCHMRLDVHCTFFSAALEESNEILSWSFTVSSSLGQHPNTRMSSAIALHPFSPANAWSSLRWNSSGNGEMPNGIRSHLYRPHEVPNVVA